MRKIVFILTVVILFLSDNYVLAQKIKVDSLQKLLLKYDDEDEKHLHLLNELSIAKVNTNPDSAITTADEAIALAQKLNNQQELTAAFNNKGFIQMRKGNYDDANTLLNKSLALNSSIKNQIGIASNYCNIGELLRRQGETDSAKTTFEHALTLFEDAQNKMGIADVSYYLGLCYRDLGDDKTGMRFNDRAIKLYTEAKDESGLALAINALGSYHYRIGNYKEAIEWINKSMAMNERNGNLYALSVDYGNLSNTYSEFPDYPRALDYLLKSLRIHELFGSVYLQAFGNGNIGIIYVYLNQLDKAKKFTLKAINLIEQLKSNNQTYHVALNNMGLIALKQNDFQTAFKYLFKVITLELETKDQLNAGESFRYLGEVYTHINKYDSAIVSFNRAIEYDKKIESTYGLSQDYLDLGKAIASASEVTLSQAGIKPSEQNSVAIEKLEKAIQLGKGTNAKEAQRDAYRQLSIIYEKQGETKKSFDYFKQYVAYKDSIMNKENSNAVAALQIQYDTEKKEQQIALLSKDTHLQQTEIQKQKTQRNGLIGGCALVLLLAGITYNRYRIKQKANTEIEKTMKHLRSTQNKLVEREKLAHLGKLTADIAKEIDVPVLKIKNINIKIRELLQQLKSGHSDPQLLMNLRNNLQQVYKSGKDADGIVKRVLTETRKISK